MGSLARTLLITTPNAGWCPSRSPCGENTLKSINPALDPNTVIQTPHEKMKQIVLAICREHGVKLNIILSAERSARVVAARKTAIRKINAEFPNLTTVQIGRFFDINHSSVLHHLGRIPKRQSVATKGLH